MESPYVADEADPDLLSYFDKSAMVVHQSFQRFEQGYARPGMSLLVKSFQTRPVRSTFLAVFAILSLLPLLSFIGFSLFILASFVFFSLAGALLAASIVIMLSGVLLGCTLMILFFISIPLTAFALGAFIAFRLAVRVRSDGYRAGVGGWAQETKNQFYRTAPEEDALKADEDVSHSGSDAVMIIGTIPPDGLDKKSAQEDRDADTIVKSESE
ncbi:hypothetical protein A0H81_13265 [Grifola frondosa]|uniref:Promethin n=1 Tax=Grifola frondosa TaxID=5627 RepID=A0A1C7LQP2_GRIFR|nr:hypothetical protein A0H81_13265 [Grifola frondosa]